VVVAILSLACAVHGFDFKFKSQTFVNENVQGGLSRRLSVLYDMEQMKFRSDYTDTATTGFGSSSGAYKDVDYVAKHETGLLIDVPQKQLIMYTGGAWGTKKNGKPYDVPSDDEAAEKYGYRSQSSWCFRVQLMNDIDRVRQCIAEKEAKISSSVEVVEGGTRFELRVNHLSESKTGGLWTFGKWQVDENSVLKRAVRVASWQPEQKSWTESSSGSAPSSVVFDPPETWGICDEEASKSKRFDMASYLFTHLETVVFPDALSECLGLSTAMLTSAATTAVHALV